jgi:hypothetical protein
MSMPKIDIHNCGLTVGEWLLCQGILNSKTGELRASKPKVARKVIVGQPDEFGIRHYDFATEGDAHTGRTAYIWRMVCFFVSPISQHHCMPVTCDFDLPGDFDQRRQEAKDLDAIVDKIVNSVPKEQWYGVNRWAKALGY